MKYYVKYARSARSRKHEQDCGAVRSLTRLVAAWKRRSRDRPGFVHAEQRCTDAALVLDASTRLAAAARSGLIDLHVAFVVDHADGSHQRAAHVGHARKLTLRASGGSNTPSSYTQTQRSCWTHLHVYQQPREAASSIGTLHSRRRPCRWVASTRAHVGHARKLTLRASGGSNTPSSYT